MLMYSSWGMKLETGLLHRTGRHSNEHTILNVMTFSNEMRPALCSATIALYTGTGLPPVGSPNTNGRSAVGAKVRMRSVKSHALEKSSSQKGLSSLFSHP